MHTCGDTDQWREAQMRYGEYREELDMQIELSIGLQYLRIQLREWGEYKMRQERKKERERKEFAKEQEIDIQLPAIHDAYGNAPGVQIDASTAISRNDR